MVGRRYGGNQSYTKGKVLAINAVVGKVILMGLKGPKTGSYGSNYSIKSSMNKGGDGRNNRGLSTN
jgi:hypothetical protein